MNPLIHLMGEQSRESFNVCLSFLFLEKTEIFRTTNRAGKTWCFVLVNERGGKDSEGGTFSRGINCKSSLPTRSIWRHCTFQKCKSRSVGVRGEEASGVRGRKGEETHESHLLFADSRMMCGAEGVI